MPNIEGQKRWSEVRLLETHELARGGANGNLNEQAKALADRTEFLNQEKADKSEIVQGIHEFSTYAEFDAYKANLPLNCTVVIGEENTTGTGEWGIGNNRWDGSILKKSGFDPFLKAQKYSNEIGDASISGNLLSNINYVTSSRTLELKNTIYVTKPNDVINLITPQSIPLPANTPYRLEYDVATGLISAVAYNATRTQGKLNLGTVTASATTLKTVDFGFTVDDVVQNPPHRGELITDVATRINFNDATAQLILSGSIRLKTPYLTTTLDHLTAEQKVIAYPATAGTYFLQYDLTKKVFSFRLNSAGQPLNTADVGMVAFANSSVTAIKGIDTYTSSLGAIYPPQNGELLTDVPSRIAFDTVNSLLTIAGGVRIKSPQYTANVGAEAKTVVIPTTNGIYRLQYDIKTGVFSLVLASTVQANSSIALGTVYVSTAGLKVTGITNYTVDGVAVGGNPLGVKIGYLIATAASEINFDFKTKQLIIAAGRVRLVTTSSIPELLPAVTLDISGDESYIKRLMYGVKTKTFRAIRANAPATEDEIQVALFCVNTKFVSGVPYYQINGSDSTGQKDDVAKANFIIPYGNLEAAYTQPDLPAYTIMQTETLGDFTKMYALYDALMAQDPSHITKTVLGVDGLGNEIRQYQFNAPEVATVSIDHPKKPKIIIFSGVHGYEPTGVFNTFSAMKQIIERWEDDPHLEALYWGVNFIVVPVCNPSGFNTSNRYNHNDVDLARNFTADWSAAQTNSGGSPMSQAETVIMDAVMSNNMDAIYCFSHHNFHTPTTVGGAGNFIWNASATSFGRYLAKTLIIGQTIRAKKRYPEIMPQTNDYYIGYADNGSPPGSEGVQATKIYGIQAGTFEIGNRWFWEAGTPPNSAIVATMGVETLINWLLLNVKHACAFYNTKINL